MGLDPKVWLPHFQFVMQTMAISYPANPNDVSIEGDIVEKDKIIPWS